LKRKIIVFGSGFLGTEIYKESLRRNCISKKTRLHSDQEIIQLDIKDQTQVKNLIESEKPEILINCISKNDVDFIEKDNTEAMNVNALGPRTLSDVCKKINCRLIHISTDSIFDGTKGMYTESEQPVPINAYARTKFRGEEEIRNNIENFVIIRTNFFGINRTGRYLLNNIISKLKNNEKIQGFKDVIFTPLPVDNLAQQIMDVAFSEFQGILNLSSNKPISKLDFCNIVAKKLDFDNCDITECSIDDFGFDAARPKNTSLDNSLSKSIIKHKPIGLDEWLDSSKGRIKEYFNLEDEENKYED